MEPAEGVSHSPDADYTLSDGGAAKPCIVRFYVRGRDEVIAVLDETEMCPRRVSSSLRTFGLRSERRGERRAGKPLSGAVALPGESLSEALQRGSERMKNDTGTSVPRP
jgi:hypothetical protein